MRVLRAFCGRRRAGLQTPAGAKRSCGPVPAHELAALAHGAGDYRSAGLWLPTHGAATICAWAYARLRAQNAHMAGYRPVLRLRSRCSGRRHPLVRPPRFRAPYPSCVPCSRVTRAHLKLVEGFDHFHLQREEFWTNRARNFESAHVTFVRCMQLENGVRNSRTEHVIRVQGARSRLGKMPRAYPGSCRCRRQRIAAERRDTGLSPGCAGRVPHRVAWRWVAGSGCPFDPSFLGYRTQEVPKEPYCV